MKRTKVFRLGSGCVIAALACLLSSGCAMLKSRRPPPTPTAVCAFTKAPIHIDGVMEAAWLSAPVVPRFFLPATGAAPESHTEVRLLWNHEYLYVFFTAKDRDIMGYEKTNDNFTFKDDVLEIFLKPKADAVDYCNFEINVLGTVYDAFIPRLNVPMDRRWRAWDCEGLQVATKVTGTLNDYHDEDELWTMEVAIPFRSLPPCREHPVQVGDVWHVLFARYDYSMYLEKGVELSASVPLSRAAFHAIDEYGPMVFK